MPRAAHLVDAAGVQVHVVEWGTPGAPPVLLLHGGMAHARWWDLVAARLADRLHLFAVDMPGHGDSPWLDPERYGAGLETPIIGALLARLAPGGWTVCGHSHGALLATLLAAGGAIPPDRLVLVDMPLHPASPRLMRAGSHFRAIRQPAFATREEGLAAFRLFPGDSLAPPEVVRYVAEHSLRPGVEDGWTTKFDWRFFGARRPDSPNPFAGLADRLRDVRCPALALRGEASTILAPEEHREMVSRLPGGRGVVIPGAAHNPHLENPDATSGAVARFVIG